MKKLKKVYLLYLFLFSSYLFSFPVSDSSYYPMALGNEWKFSASFSPHSEIITDTLRVDGNLYYGFTRFMPQPEYWLREYDNRIYCLNRSSSTEFILFDFTIDIGQSIELPPGFECSFSRKITLVSKNDTITTHAGTFYNCYHFEHQINCMDAGIMDTWLVKGIGKVKYKEMYFAGLIDFELNDYSIITSVNSQDGDKINSAYDLFQNYPNPFNPITTIEYTIVKSDEVKIIIYDITGREVKTILNEYKNAGRYKVLFNAGNLSSGIYYYRLINKYFIRTKAMVLLK